MNAEQLKARTKNFAHRCVKLALSLPKTGLGKHLGNQLIRSSTSVAANYRAACVAQSKAAFVAKLSIALEEADESVFWVEFIRDEHLFDDHRLLDLLTKGKEICSILASSRKSSTKPKAL